MTFAPLSRILNRSKDRWPKSWQTRWPLAKQLVESHLSEGLGRAIHEGIATKQNTAKVTVSFLQVFQKIGKTVFGLGDL